MIDVINLVDTLKGEINRMCVTDDLLELESMALCATLNLERLLDIRLSELRQKEKNDE